VNSDPCTTVELRMDARPENLAYARLALAGVAAGVGASREVIADLKLAVTEACANAIQHAYVDGGREEVVIRYDVRPDGLAVEVQDWGMGFEASRVRSRELEAAPDPARDDLEGLGMGLLIIGAITDELTIESSGAGSRVAFVRRFGVEGAGAVDAAGEDARTEA
jgi:serine/threonine-protein kinase RsbW